MSLVVDPSTLDNTTRRMLSGMTPFFACTRDPRFSGRRTRSDDSAELPLLVLIHGVRRDTHVLLSRMQSFADKQGVALMVPLFPAGVGDPRGLDVHNYKAVAYRPPGGDEVIRFDEILLAMVAQAARTWRLAADGERLWIHGFSGGGQFVHLFVLLHPARVRGASVGAPTAVVHLPHPAHSAKEKDAKAGHNQDRGWCLRDAVDGGVFPPRVGLFASRSSEGGYERQARTRDNFENKALGEHTAYWSKYPGKYRHERFADGFAIGWDDAYTFFAASSRLDRPVSELGFVGAWAKTRTDDHSSFWEFEHGFKQGVKAARNDFQENYC
ncbi:hypothetical protein C8R45DRAFT_1098504 [Mycena sanguinolenta]|nr:hypothetical protein C8R45DRAFT_1098504 [Mycena sanguinolenta]